MQWITQYWVEWIFGIVAAVLIWMWKRLMNKVKEERAQQEAIKKTVINSIMLTIQII